MEFLFTSLPRGSVEFLQVEGSVAGGFAWDLDFAGALGVMALPDFSVVSTFALDVLVGGIL